LLIADIENSLIIYQQILDVLSNHATLASFYSTTKFYVGTWDFNI